MNATPEPMGYRITAGHYAATVTVHRLEETHAPEIEYASTRATVTAQLWHAPPGRPEPIHRGTAALLEFESWYTSSAGEGTRPDADAVAAVTGNDDAPDIDALTEALEEILEGITRLVEDAADELSGRLDNAAHEIRESILEAINNPAPAIPIA